MAVDSPCIGICILDDDVCIGCGRTSAQIFQAGVDAERERQAQPTTERPRHGNRGGDGDS